MKNVLLLALLGGLPVFAQAADVRISTDGIKIESGKPAYNFGDRDKRGYYWDGNTWRDQAYWDKHHGKGKGKDCPPGQAKKGSC